MNREQIKKVNSIINEVEGLERYKDLIDTDENTIHFELRMHYGNCEGRELIQINSKHNTKFIKALMNVINELNDEINSYTKE